MAYPVTSYITVADAREYAVLMDLVAVEGLSDGDLELQLKRAAIYLDRNYGARYLGNRAIGSQVLFWPRAVLSYYDSVGNFRSDFTTLAIPKELGQASVELVQLMLDNDALFNTAPSDLIKMKKETIEGAVSTMYEYVNGAYESGIVRDPLWKLEPILTPILKPDGFKVSKVITMSRGA